MILFSNNEKGLQNNLMVSNTSVPTIKMIVNETKTKLMVFGKEYSGNLFFNNDEIELVKEYKYLGNIVRSTEMSEQDVFSLNHVYQRDRANRAIFSIL